MTKYYQKTDKTDKIDKIDKKQEEKTNSDKTVSTKSGKKKTASNKLFRNKAVAFYIKELPKKMKFRFNLANNTVEVNDRPLCREVLVSIKENLVEEFGGFNTDSLDEAIDILAFKNKYNPVQEYLNLLPDTDTNYLDNYLTLLLGVEDNEVTRLLGRKWLISAVARAMDPGCYIEGVLCLYGGQGNGKSRFLRELPPNERWSCDSQVSVSNQREASQTYQGAWIIEWAEQLRGKSIEDMKQFITTKSDVYVPKYSNNNEEYLRSYVFALTTNNESFLRDRTGNRRFWSVEVSRDNDADEMSKKLSLIRDKLWREALDAYRSGESWTLSAEERVINDENNERFMPIDPQIEVLESINWTDKGLVKTSFIKQILKENDLKWNNYSTPKILGELGLVQKRTASTRGWEYQGLNKQQEKTEEEIKS